MKLEGGECLVLRTLLDLQGDSGVYIEDALLAAAARMPVGDVRDLLATLEGKGFVERARGTEGLSAYVTAKGKQALSVTEPISSPASTGVGAGSAGPSVSTSTVAAQPAASTHTAGPPGPIRLFYSYSHHDEDLRKELDNHLSLLRRTGLISAWHDRMIGTGDEWKGAIDKNLEEAHVILLLVSSSVLASDYCWDVETKQAVERHDGGEAKVIPIILRPCDWHGAPFGKLQVLPGDGKAVTSWSNRDEAFTKVAQEIRRAVEPMTANPH
jgi:TIR domain